MNKDALWKAIKEPLRYVALSVVSWLVTEGVALSVKALFGETISQEMQLILVAGLIALLRGVDKYLHEVGVEESTKTEQSPLLTGLTRF